MVRKLPIFWKDICKISLGYLNLLPIFDRNHCVIEWKMCENLHTADFHYSQGHFMKINFISLILKCFFCVLLPKCKSVENVRPRLEWKEFSRIIYKQQEEPFSFQNIVLKLPQINCVVFGFCLVFFFSRICWTCQKIKHLHYSKFAELFEFKWKKTFSPFKKRLNERKYYLILCYSLNW